MVVILVALVVGYIAYRELHNSLLWGAAGAAGTYLLLGGLS